MNRAFRALLAIFMIIILVSSSISISFQYQPPHDMPGPAVDRIGFRAFATEIAPASLEKEEMDLYIFGLKTATAKELLGKPGIEMYQAPATSVSIILNPAPSPPGELNPLSIREIRYALQYIVNREFVAGEIYRGLAVPMVAHISPLDFDYLTIYDLVKKFNIRYDPEYAKKVIGEALTDAGALMKEGRWFYNNKPITLKFVIRVEDERRETGDLLASELEKLGFTVERIYQLFGPAIHKVYGTDPRLFEWHLYTEGWGKGSAERYDYASINQMYAPWLGNMPGWKEVGYWQYENPDLDGIGQKIFRGEFKDIEERNRLYKQATELGIKESVRLWVVTVINNLPSKAGIEGVTSDIAAGPKSLWTLREAYIPGKRDLTVGSLWVWTERTIWNPIGGFGDVYSSDIWRNIYDPPIARHPFTGLPIAFRVEYKVETAGPTGKLNVPEDAFIWKPKEGWRNLGPEVKATSRVTFNYEKYINSLWHHEMKITMADVIYSIYQTFDLTYDSDKSKIEVSIATTSRPYLDTFRGFRIVNSTSIEVYVDYWHFIPNYIAEYSNVVGLSMPWEILLSMDTLVFEKRRAAYSDTASEKFQVPWLSLVMDKDSRLIRTTLKELLSKEFLPEDIFKVGGRLLASREEASERYNASLTWFDKYGMMVISNGPFKLVKFDPPSQYAELEAFRDSTYPFKPGQWYFGKPASIQIVGIKDGRIALGSEAIFKVDADGPGQLGLKYLLYDAVEGRVLTAGEGELAKPKSFIIKVDAEITSRLKPSVYQLILLAYSDQLSSVAERVEFIEAGPTITEVTTPTTPTTTTTTTPTTTTSPTQPSPPEVVAGPDTTPIWLATGIVLAAAVVVAILVFRRKKKP